MMIVQTLVLLTMPGIDTLVSQSRSIAVRQAKGQVEYMLCFVQIWDRIESSHIDRRALNEPNCIRACCGIVLKLDDRVA